MSGVKRKGRLSRARTRQRVVRILMARDGIKCHWCNQDLIVKPTIDHLVEVQNGGTDDLQNLVLACRPCNNYRSNNPTRFLERAVGI